MLSLLCKDLCVFIVALRGKAETVFTSSLCCKFLCDIVTLWSEVCFLVLFECSKRYRSGITATEPTDENAENTEAGKTVSVLSYSIPDIQM